MALGLSLSEWVPVVTIATLFVLVVFGTAAVASKTWADLIGLFYLAASPLLYQFLKSAVPASVPWSDESVDQRVDPG